MKRDDGMGEAIALSSPSGRMSKRARRAAINRLATTLFNVEHDDNCTCESCQLEKTYLINLICSSVEGEEEVTVKDATPFCEKPLADRGLISYRYKGRYGWIMIGAHNHADALREAGRSTDDSITIENLQVWNETKFCYTEASEMSDCLTASSLGRLGGLVKSEVKSTAARENGRKGGRPSKQLDIEDI